VERRGTDLSPGASAAQADGDNLGQPRLVNLATSCTTEDQFVAQFRPFVNASTVFIPSKIPLALGQSVHFSITLKNGAPMLQGRGVVVEVKDAGGPGNRPGLRVRIGEVSDESKRIRAALAGDLKRGAKPPPTPPPQPVDPNGATRLFSQGVQASVPADGGGPKVAFEGWTENPFKGVSTESVVFYLECNLAAKSSGTAPAPVEAVTTAPWPEAGADDDPPSIDAWPDPPSQPYRIPARRPLLRKLAPMAGSSLVTLVICWLAWGRAATPVVAPARVASAHAPAKAAPAKPQPAKPQPAKPQAAAPHEPMGLPALVVLAPPPATSAPKPAAAPPEAAPPAAGPCKASIDSHPAGATVALGGRVLGVTPLAAVEVPCQESALVLTRPRYNPGRATLAPTPGTQATVSVRLARPPASLLLTSTPANAVFKVNRASLGRSPQEAPVMRFESAHIEATLAGYRPWQQTVYLSTQKMTIHAVLVPLRSPPAKSGKR
jgi:hypothetical protein